MGAESFHSFKREGETGKFDAVFRGGGGATSFHCMIFPF